MAYTSFSGGGDERRLQIWTGSRYGSTPTLLFESSSIAKTGGGPVWSPDGTRVAFGDAPGGGEPVWLVANADGTGHASEIDELRYLSGRGGWYFCECYGSGRGSGAWERREGRRTFGQIASKREHAHAARSPDPCEGMTTKEEGEMKATRLNKFTVAGLGVLLLLGITSAYAATSVISGTGTMANFEPFGGPATMTARSLFIGANEVLPWHQHPGIGAYTIVKTGTLTVEDGCGGEVVYPQGSAFIEPAGRVHRGIAGDVPVETVQTFLVPLGSGFSVNVPKGCGAPLAVDECKGDGWETFTYPRTFSDQGDCVAFVLRGDG